MLSPTPSGPSCMPPRSTRIRSNRSSRSRGLLCLCGFGLVVLAEQMPVPSEEKATTSAGSPPLPEAKAEENPAQHVESSVAATSQQDGSGTGAGTSSGNSGNVAILKEEQENNKVLGGDAVETTLSSSHNELEKGRKEEAELPQSPHEPHHGGSHHGHALEVSGPALSNDYDFQGHLLTDPDRDGVLEADYDHDGIPESHVYTKFIHKLLPADFQGLVKDYASDVRVLVNKMWPSQNPRETYRYYDFPLACAPDVPVPQLMSLGQVLNGDRLMNSMLDFKRLPPEYWRTSIPADQGGNEPFVWETAQKLVCNRDLPATDVERLRQAIDDWFVAEIVVDEFPVADYIGIKLNEESAAYFSNAEKQKLDDAGWMKTNLAERMWGNYGESLYSDYEVTSDDEYYSSPKENPAHTLGRAGEQTGVGAAAASVKALASNLPRVHPVKDDEKMRYFIRNHYEFEITHSKGDIMQVKLRPPLPGGMFELPVEGPAKIPFYVSVHWYPSSDFGMTRAEALDYQIMHNYADLVGDYTTHGDAPPKVHWFAILNSFAVVFVVLMLASCVLIRNLKRDLYQAASGPAYSSVEMTNVIGAKSSPGRVRDLESGGKKNLDDIMTDFEDDDFDDLRPQTGWKLLHADVFRAPKFRTVFASLIGTGTQLLVMALSVILLGCLSNYHPGTVLSTMAFFYVSSAVIAGYVSGALYQKLGGERWTLNILLTALMFALPVFVIWSFLNTVAIFYSSTVAVPFGTICLLFGMWVCVTVPLTILGGIVGRQVVIRRRDTQSDIASYFPCKTNKLERHIPESAKSWSQGLCLQYAVCGGLPFVSMGTELHYVFDSVWGGSQYRVYGLLLLTLVLTLVCSSILAILFIYAMLNVEDYRWWWRSFYSGASLAFFFNMYCVYYFRRSLMDSFLQGAFFFMYSLLISYALALMFGAITYYSCSQFLHFIYARIKSD